MYFSLCVDSGLQPVDAVQVGVHPVGHPVPEFLKIDLSALDGDGSLQRGDRLLQRFDLLVEDVTVRETGFDPLKLPNLFLDSPALHVVEGQFRRQNGGRRNVSG